METIEIEVDERTADRWSDVRHALHGKSAGEILALMLDQFKAPTEGPRSERMAWSPARRNEHLLEILMAFDTGTANQYREAIKHCQDMVDLDKGGEVKRGLAIDVLMKRLQHEEKEAQNSDD